MARIRTLKPEILEDEKTAGLSDAAYRLFTSLIVLADDWGNIRAESRWLEGQIWWARRETPRVAELLRELNEAGLVQLYAVRNQAYCNIKSWTKHQRIDNASKPRVPKLDESDETIYDVFPDGFGETPQSSASLRETPLDPDPDQGPPKGTPTSDAAAGGRGRKRRPEIPIPDDFVPQTDPPPGVDRGIELQRFRNHAMQNDRRCRDWQAAWRNWVLNAGQRASVGPGNRPPQTALDAQLRRIADLERAEREGDPNDPG